MRSIFGLKLIHPAAILFLSNVIFGNAALWTEEKVFAMSGSAPFGFRWLLSVLGLLILSWAPFHMVASTIDWTPSRKLLSMERTRAIWEFGVRAMGYTIAISLLGFEGFRIAACMKLMAQLSPK